MYGCLWVFFFSSCFSGYFWLLIITATGKVHLWDRSARTVVLCCYMESADLFLQSHPVTVYRHRTSQSYHRPHDGRRLAGKLLKFQRLIHMQRTDLCNKSCLASWLLSVRLSSMAKTLTLDITCKLFDQILSYLTCL